VTAVELELSVVGSEQARDRTGVRGCDERVGGAGDQLCLDPRCPHGPELMRDIEPAHRVRKPYTIDDEATMQRVIDLGVDGIISDDPDLLLLVAKRNGLA
jgi:glycerophosphoryl diester phosphodiesterase